MSTNTKPLAEWTLGDIQSKCKEQGELYCNDCPFDTENGCRINCRTPNLWDLTEKPRFTGDEVAVAKSIRRLFPRADNIERSFYPDGLYVWIGRKTCITQIDENLFPSILSGQRVEIGAVVGQKENRLG